MSRLIGGATLTSSTSAGLPVEGWYPDPTAPGRQRYWSGTEWTQFVWSPGDAEASTSPVEPLVAADASSGHVPAMVDAVARNDISEGSEIGPGPSTRSWGTVTAPLRAPVWLRLLAFALVAFTFGLTANGFLFVGMLIAAAWCIHGAVRRRASDGKQRRTSRRVLLGVVVPLGLIVIGGVSGVLGDALHMSRDPVYAAQVAERRAQSEEDRKRQEAQDLINEQAQASRDAEKAQIQASQEAAAAAQASQELCRRTALAPMSVARKAVEEAGRITVPVWAGNETLDMSISIKPFISGDTLVPGLNAMNEWGQSHPECASPELQDFLVKMLAAVNYFRQGGLVHGQPPNALPTADDVNAMITVSKAGSALAQQVGVDVTFPDFEQWIEDIRNP